MSIPKKTVQPSPSGRTSRERDEISHLVAQRNTLVDRLETGSRQIEQMRQAGENVEQWEQFWLRLLHQYEQACDKLARYEDQARLRRAS